MTVATVSRAILAGVFVLAGLAKVSSYPLFAADVAGLFPTLPTFAPLALILLEVLTGCLLVSSLHSVGAALAGLMICGFVGFSILRWDYIAQGCSCFGTLPILSGTNGHRVLLTAMAALLSLALTAGAKVAHRGRMAAGAVILTVVIFLAMGQGYTTTTSLEVSELGRRDVGHIRLGFEQPALVVRWDCPECQELLSALAASTAPQSLNIVFTYPKWLDVGSAETSALEYSESLGLVGRPGLGLYLDQEFRLEATPILIVAVPGTTLSRVVARPNLRVVERFSLANDDGP